MLIEIKQQLPNGDLVITPIKETGEYPESNPKVGEKYTVFFESVVPDPIPEFNA